VLAAADPECPNRRPGTTFYPPQQAVLQNFEGAKLERGRRAAAGQFQTKFFDRDRVEKLTVQSELLELIFHAADVT
jgi:hypothetical protein